MTPPVPLTRGRLRTPRAAAVAGILFSGLLTLAFLLLLSAVPRDSAEHGAWLASGLDRVVLAINLIPFAGVAFLWFIGVVRDRLAEAEDRLFATVFLGSGLLFLVLMFVASAVFGAIVLVHVAHPGALSDSPAFALARAFAYTLVNVYAIRMAGMFVLITSTMRCAPPSSRAGWRRPASRWDCSCCSPARGSTGPSSSSRCGRC